MDFVCGDVFWIHGRSNEYLLSAEEPREIEALTRQARENIL